MDENKRILVVKSLGRYNWAADQGDNRMEQRDTLIFLIEALAVNKKTHQEIDKLYKTKESLFSGYARRSPLFEHLLIAGGSARHEEYGKKALGIALYAMENKDMTVSDRVDDIVEKGWPRAYDHIIHYNKAKMESYIAELKRGASQSAAESTAELFVFYSLCMKIPTLVVRIGLKEIQRFFLMLSFRGYLNTNDKYVDLLGELDENAKQDVEKLKSSIFRRYGIELAADNRVHIKDKWLAKQYRHYYRLAFTERISLYYLLKDVTFGEDDIMEVFCALSGEMGGDVEDMDEAEAASLFLSGLMVKLMAKAVAWEKSYYFQRLAEHEDGDAEKKEQTIAKLTRENEGLAAEARRLKESVDALTQRLREEKKEAEKLYLGRIRELERELAKRDEGLRQEREKERELVGLRDFFFNMENQALAQEGGTETKPGIWMDLKDTSGAIFGGKPRWSTRMKELLPKWVFISSPGFDKRSLDGIQTVCFVPGNMSHTLYYKAMNIAKAKNMEIGFIHSQNEQLALQEIAKVLAKAES